MENCLTLCEKLKYIDGKFSIDFHRCGKCLVEYESLEDFIYHKVTEDGCSLVLSESKKLNGICLQIPSFLEFAEDRKKSVVESDIATLLGNNGSSNVEIKRRRGRPRKIEDNVCAKNIMDITESKLDVWKCSQCRLTFMNPLSLKSHHESEHQRLNAVSCSIKTSGEAENSSHSGSNQMSVARANRLGISERLPVLGINKDELPKESVCPKCGNKYKDPIVLKTHLSTVHCENRPYKCKYDCSLTFKTKGSLMRHMRRHTGERPYVCKKCGRSFRESGALTRHLKSRFPCSTKTDNDLARYGKTVGLEKFDYIRPETEFSLPKAASTIKVIISEISKKSRVSVDNQLNSDSSSVDCDIIVRDVESNENDSVESIKAFDHSVEGCPKFPGIKDSRNAINNDLEEIIMNVTATGDVFASESKYIHLENCDESTKTAEDLLIEDKDLKCLACMQSFLNKLDFRNHLLLHLEDLRFRCIQCCYVCQTKEHLVRHQSRKHGVPTTNDMFQRKNLEVVEDSLEDFAEEDEDDENIQNTVKLLFRAQNSIEADELVCSGLIKKPAKHSNRCHICLKRFSGSLYLGCHMGIHTGEKPFICDICKKSFYLKDSLKKHSLCHSEERKYRCGECYKSFKRLSHVRDHLRIHSKLCPYQCAKCGKAFRWQGTLKSHEMSHGGSSLKLHHCSTCGRKFPSKWSLARHQRLHPSETSCATRHITFQGTHGSAFKLERTSKKLDCLPDSKIICISDNEMVIRKQNAVCVDHDSFASGTGGETYVLITQEDGSSCFVPTVTIVEEIPEETISVNHIEDG